jgi:RIO-like serine/threonine protein kinase
MIRFCKDFELPPWIESIEKFIGSGVEGVVYSGFVNKTPVAIKFCIPEIDLYRQNIPEQYIDDFPSILYDAQVLSSSGFGAKYVASAVIPCNYVLDKITRPICIGIVCTELFDMTLNKYKRVFTSKHDAKHACMMWRNMLDEIIASGFWPDDLSPYNTVVKVIDGKVSEIKLIDVELLKTSECTQQFIKENKTKNLHRIFKDYSVGNF